ncbi:serine hydrolase [Bacillus sp. FJAT-26390]|uniref:serine hydrolase domain-containing protein n=1 Tax=Bacillus sp. FJAT-26390 TaxID=1743142 RepID=UPI000807B065|nr:serine hydrolase domain-containing protein [Bacillus sp. FJAT-26390]OBZ09263.1 hypothetical protein A7975_24445 [Bacillus sp. FJAT-26390]
MKLIEDGKLYIDFPVAPILEEFNNPVHKDHLVSFADAYIRIMPVTVYYNEPYPREWWGAGCMDNWISKVLQGPLVCEPGAAYNYSTVGFALLGEMISRVSGMAYESYVIENIIQPLKMNRTFFDVPAHLHAEVCTVDNKDLKRIRAIVDGSPKPPSSLI